MFSSASPAWPRRGRPGATRQRACTRWRSPRSCWRWCWSCTPRLRSRLAQGPARRCRLGNVLDLLADERSSTRARGHAGVRRIGRVRSGSGARFVRVRRPAVVRPGCGGARRDSARRGPVERQRRSSQPVRRPAVARRGRRGLARGDRGTPLDVGDSAGRCAPVFRRHQRVANGLVLCGLRRRARQRDLADTDRRPCRQASRDRARRHRPVAARGLPAGRHNEHAGAASNHGGRAAHRHRQCGRIHEPAFVVLALRACHRGRASRARRRYRSAGRFGARACGRFGGCPAARR